MYELSRINMKKVSFFYINSALKGSSAGNWNVTRKTGRMKCDAGLNAWLLGSICRQTDRQTCGCESCNLLPVGERRQQVMSDRRPTATSRPTAHGSYTPSNPRFCRDVSLQLKNCCTTPSCPLQMNLRTELYEVNLHSDIQNVSFDLKMTF
jgi:hypothetical protein